MASVCTAPRIWRRNWGEVCLSAATGPAGGRRLRWKFRLKSQVRKMPPQVLPEVPPNRRVLLVDDTEAIHRDYRKILAGPGESLSTLSDARSALFGEADDSAAGGDVHYELDSAFQGQQA